MVDIPSEWGIIYLVKGLIAFMDEWCYRKENKCQKHSTSQVFWILRLDNTKGYY